MLMPVEWYRTPDYDQAAKAEFARRYNRARRPSRVQYKVIKAIQLMETGEPGANQWAEELLTEITADDDAYRHDKGGAFESLAGSTAGADSGSLPSRHLSSASTSPARA
jgi:hypothetical protein